MNKNIIGKTVSSISRGDLLLNGQQNEEDLGPLEIVFTDGSSLTMALVSDGESVCSEFTERQPNKLFAQNTEFQRVTLTNKEPFAKAVNSKVASIDILLFSSQRDSVDVVAGYRVNLENGHTIVYYNSGDFAKIYWDSLPPSLPSQFILKWESTLK